MTNGAVLFFDLALATLLAFLEVLFFKGPVNLASSWLTIYLVAGANMIFMVAVFLGSATYPWLVFPIPLVPALYLFSKVGAYRIGQLHSGGPPHSWKGMLLFMLLLYLPMFSATVYGPSTDNLAWAAYGKPGRLQFWLRLGIKPNADEIVEIMKFAILGDKAESIELLIRHGADPRRDYFANVREGAHDGENSNRRSQWLVVKWMLDSGVKPDEFESWYPLKRLALHYGVAELRYCIEKGFDPAKYADVIHLALLNQQLRAKPVMSPDGSFDIDAQPDEIQSLHDKIALLLSHGADVNRRNSWKETPLHYLTAGGLEFQRDHSRLEERDSLTTDWASFSPTDLSPI